MGGQVLKQIWYFLGVFYFHCSFIISAKRLNGMVGDWDSADGGRVCELQFAAPIVRRGAQLPGIPQGGCRGGDECLQHLGCPTSLARAVPFPKMDSLKPARTHFDFV